MYVVEAVGALVASLVALCGPETEVYVAHGRNRQAEPDFLRAAAPHFTVEAVPREELDATYQCADVDVLRLRLRPGGAAAAGGAGAAAVEAAAGGAGAAAAVVDGAGACIEGLNGAEK